MLPEENAGPGRSSEVDSLKGTPPQSSLKAGMMKTSGLAQAVLSLKSRFLKCSLRTSGLNLVLIQAGSFVE